MGLVDEIFSQRIPWEGDMEVKHKSAFIRALCKGRSEVHVSGAEVFIIIYLKKRAESEGIEIKDVMGLDEAIELEENISRNRDS